MSDGKRAVKSDVVILSIKPKRPEFPEGKKSVPIKLALEEWDKLDAYYRGQILKLKCKVKTVDRKTSTGLKSPSSTPHKKSRRQSHSGHHLSELFGDENDKENLSHVNSNKEVKRPKKLEHPDKDKKIKKHDKEGKKSEQCMDDEENNYLSVPRDNFLIEFAIGQKKRTPVHNSPHQPGFISAIKVEPYKPPIAIGLNGVHIQKILYHKSDGNQQTSPTTTTARTPENEKPPIIESSKSPNLIPNLNTYKSMEMKQSSSSECIRNNGTANLKRKPENCHNQNDIVSTSEDCPPKKSSTESSPVKEFAFARPKPYVSITDKIIKQAKDLSPELKEREKRRRQESQRRKAYALLKGNEYSLMDSVDVSMKAMEMIWTQPLLSPIRSP